MPNGRTYGEALLDPTPLFNTVVEDLLRAGIGLHYVANITGHGWRKFMRPQRPLRYVFTAAPKVPDVLEYICKVGPVEEKESFETFNMGALAGLYVAQEDTEKACATLADKGERYIVAGGVEAADEREVIVPSWSGDLRWSGTDLDF
jgi:phosphoribosylformylglycinamidine cyclo-ligase